MTEDLQDLLENSVPINKIVCFSLGTLRYIDDDDCVFQHRVACTLAKEIDKMKHVCSITIVQRSHALSTQSSTVVITKFDLGQPRLSFWTVASVPASHAGRAGDKTLLTLVPRESRSLSVIRAV